MLWASWATDEANADVAGGAVALDHGEFQNVSVGIGDDLAVDRLRLLDEVFGDDLVRHHPDHPAATGRRWQAQAALVERADVDGVKSG